MELRHWKDGWSDWNINYDNMNQQIGSIELFRVRSEPNGGSHRTGTKLDSAGRKLSPPPSLELDKNWKFLNKLTHEFKISI